MTKTMKMKAGSFRMMMAVAAVAVMLLPAETTVYAQTVTSTSCPSFVTNPATCEQHCSTSSSTPSSTSTFVATVTEINDWEAFQLSSATCTCNGVDGGGTNSSSESESCTVDLSLRTCDEVGVTSCSQPCSDFCTSLGFRIDRCSGINRNRECECRGDVIVNGQPSNDFDFYVCYNELGDISGSAPSGRHRSNTVGFIWKSIMVTVGALSTVNVLMTFAL